MKRVFLISIGLICYSALTFASEPAVEKELNAQPASVDVSQLTAVCAACHGADGNSAAPSYPKLAGQNSAYLYKQLKDIQTGLRPIPAMTGQLDRLSDAQLQGIASYYADQERSLNQVKDESLALAERLYRLGDASKSLPACSGCHSPTGQGNAPAGFPSLGGQHAAYIASSLKDFQQGAEYENKGRKNDSQAVMRDIALRLSDKEIEALANYISGLY